MVILADDIQEETEFFQVVLSGVEVENATGVQQELTEMDHKRIILVQDYARIIITDGMYVIIIVKIFET